MTQDDCRGSRINAREVAAGPETSMLPEVPDGWVVGGRFVVGLTAIVPARVRGLELSIGMMWSRSLRATI